MSAKFRGPWDRFKKNCRQWGSQDWAYISETWRSLHCRLAKSEEVCTNHNSHLWRWNFFYQLQVEIFLHRDSETLSFLPLITKKEDSSNCMYKNPSLWRTIHQKFQCQIRSARVTNASNFLSNKVRTWLTSGFFLGFLWGMAEIPGQTQSVTLHV